MPDCPLDMVRIDGGTFTLGEPPPTPGLDTLVIVEQELTVESFCIASHPFPGEGRAWPLDGLAAGQVGAWDAVAREHGRRSCTVAELLLAASGPRNRAQAQDPSRCEPNDHKPGRIGVFPDCHTPQGVHDLGVRSTWGAIGELQDQFPRYVGWASWGRTSREDTFYPATNRAIHAHAVDEPEYIDDGWRSCSDVGAPSPGWANFASSFPGRFGDVLADHAVQSEPSKDR